MGGGRIQESARKETTTVLAGEGRRARDGDGFKSNRHTRGDTLVACQETGEVQSVAERGALSRTVRCVFFAGAGRNAWRGAADVDGRAMQL